TMKHLTYASCYACLGIRKSANWETLRLAYRRRISVWHPDRLSGRTEHWISQRDPAAEFKRISGAYRELAEFQKQHGYLPAFDTLIGAVEPERKNKQEYARAKNRTPRRKPATHSNKHNWKFAVLL